MLNRRAFVGGAPAFLGGQASAREDEVVLQQFQFESRGHQIRAASFAPVDGPARGGLVYIHGSGSIGPLDLSFARRFAEQQKLLVLVPVYTDAGRDDGLRYAPLMNAWRRCAIDSVDWLIANGVAPEKVAISGYSLGSHIAVDSALSGGRARAAIGIAAGWDVYPPRPPRRRIPVQIIRPTSDHHVSPESTTRLIEFLRNAQVGVRESRIPDGEHLMSAAHWAQAHALAADFLTDALDLS